MTWILPGWEVDVYPTSFLIGPRATNGWRGGVFFKGMIVESATLARQREDHGYIGNDNYLHL